MRQLIPAFIYSPAFVGLQLQVSDNHTGVRYTKNPTFFTACWITTFFSDRGKEEHPGIVSAQAGYTHVWSHILYVSVWRKLVIIAAFQAASAVWHQQYDTTTGVASFSVCGCLQQQRDENHWNGEMWRITQAYLQRNCSAKVHKKCMYARNYGQGGIFKKWVKQQKRGIKWRISYCSYPSWDFTAEGTRQLQHELNCPLVPAWVPVCPFFFPQSSRSVTPPGSAES